MGIIILGIESSCDDTSAAIIKDGALLSNKVATQDVHMEYGGVVPELASRAHMPNIIPVIESAVKEAEIKNDDISAVAYTRGPGLMGSLLVGTAFAKGFALARKIPLIDINHLHAHILSLFIKSPKEPDPSPPFPFLCLLVSGGHTQLIVVKNHLEMEIIGSTIDDAAGEAFDKSAKILGLPYPGGPLIDAKAVEGNALAFNFSKPKIEGLNYSFSGLKTSFLYFLRDRMKEDPNFIANNMNDLCASIQRCIVDILMEKLVHASKETGIENIAIAGGVSCNEGLRNAVAQKAKELNWKIFIPHKKYSTDNAAMVALTGYYKYLRKKFGSYSDVPFARAKN